jgi:hypothetical protein
MRRVEFLLPVHLFFPSAPDWPSSHEMELGFRLWLILCTPAFIWWPARAEKTSLCGAATAAWALPLHAVVVAHRRW